MPNSTLTTPPQLMNALQQYGVNAANVVEAHPQIFYDYQNYPAAGSLTFQFFQNTPGASGYTPARTNMPSAGQFPNPQNFLWLGTYVQFIAGSSTSTFTPANVTNATTAAAAGGDLPADDFAAVMLSPAYYSFTINTKEYLRAAPLGSLPSPWKLRVDGTLSNTQATAALGTYSMAEAWIDGDVVRSSGQMITSNMQITGSIAFDAKVATPSSNIGLIGVVLAGIWYQAAQ